MYQVSTVLDLIIDIAVLPIPKKRDITSDYNIYRKTAKYRCPQNHNIVSCPFTTGCQNSLPRF